MLYKFSWHVGTVGTLFLNYEIKRKTTTKNPTRWHKWDFVGHFKVNHHLQKSSKMILEKLSKE